MEREEEREKLVWQYNDEKKGPKEKKRRKREREKVTNADAHTRADRETQENTRQRTG